MPINRLLKDKRTLEEIELLNKALAWLIVTTRFAIWSLARLSRSARPALTSRERLRRRPWSGLAYGKVILLPRNGPAGAAWRRPLSRVQRICRASREFQV